MDSAQNSLIDDVPLQETLSDIPEHRATLKSSVNDTNNAKNINDDTLTWTMSSTLAAYKKNSTISVSSADQRRKKRQLKQQKYWVIIHSIIWLLISACSIPVLHAKQDIMQDFYNRPQCCYCAWAGLNDTVQDSYRIEWNACHAKYNLHPRSNDLKDICTFNNTTYCNSENNKLMAPIHPETIPQIIRFNLWDIASYGFIAVIMVLIYITLIAITTFHYRLPMDERLFIGNVVCTIICYYPYIKCYQYIQHTYSKDENCPNMPFSGDGVCYRSALITYQNWIMDGMSGYLILYILYCLFRIWPCFCVWIWRCCRKYDRCRIIVNKLEKVMVAAVTYFYESSVLCILTIYVGL